MIKSRECKSDNRFKALARAHQFKYRDNVLKQISEESNPQVMLPPDAARKGLIFYKDYRNIVFNDIGKFGTTQLFSNMLRSEHIPYNIFTPMSLDLLNTANLFNYIIGGCISRITDIKIEFAGKDDKSNYLNDNTSFDAFIEYVAHDGKAGAIGIEVKYTEGAYYLGKKEKDEIMDSCGRYKIITKNSHYYNDDFDITKFIKDNDLRQIWRNHILGYSMIENGDISYFHHIHLYPRGNSHFHDIAIPKYRAILSLQGLKSFIPITYEDLFDKMNACFKNDVQVKWIEYLKERYLF